MLSRRDAIATLAYSGCPVRAGQVVPHFTPCCVRDLLAKHTSVLRLTNHQSSAHPILPDPGTRHTLVVPQLVRPSFACALRAHAYLLVARMWGLVGPTPLWRPFGFVNCLIRQVTNRPSVHACDMLSHTGGGTSTVAPDPERRPSRPTVQLLASHQPLQRMHAMQSSLNQSAIRTRR